ncbi:MAG: glycine cleavage system aminomethyltransferase GcvT [Pirellulales bacterium]|nr:glycine cleavage system aminomethyltransferase GcvT [Pirellulales bacterium]
MTDTLAKTPLADWHAAHGGRMVDFAGWLMPTHYSSIVEEHLATRTAVGVFDISHMGRLWFVGDAAARYVDSLVTRATAAMSPGRIRYALVTNDAGGILDDVLVYNLTTTANEPARLVVVNASNRPKLLNWFAAHPAPAGVELRDGTVATAMIAVQGPRAIELVAPLTSSPVGELKYYTACHARLGDVEAVVSRTGYTGEDGFELIVPAAAAERLWQGLVEAGAQPVGLGARDTLRLEAGMPLYGHELNEQIDPYQAGLGSSVDLQKPSFVGQATLAQLRDDAARPRRVGLAVAGRRIPREGATLLSAERLIGHVTSGTFSPSLERTIAMGYVEPAFSPPGTELVVEVRGHRDTATVVALPFYQRGAAPQRAASLSSAGKGSIA